MRPDFLKIAANSHVAVALKKPDPILWLDNHIKRGEKVEVLLIAREIACERLGLRPAPPLPEIEVEARPASPEANCGRGRDPRPPLRYFPNDQQVHKSQYSAQEIAKYGPSGRTTTPAYSDHGQGARMIEFFYVLPKWEGKGYYTGVRWNPHPLRRRKFLNAYSEK